MAERPPNDSEPEGQGPLGEQIRDMEIEEPRREASARFVVEGNASAQSQMRDAMDPANQSLAEALRLSYRVLQVGILALVITFLVSGFQSVREGFTGVKTIFGRIVETDGVAELAPGLHPFWPYPVGELIVFEQKRPLRLDKEFQPRDRPNATTKQASIDQADSNRELIAERDGWVLTADGDIAHISLAAEYTVNDAVSFLDRLSVAQADEVVRKALMRGTVLASSQFTLQDLVQSRGDAPAMEIKARSQEVLDRLKVGLSITSVTFTDRSPPQFVQNQFRKVQEARENAKGTVERARQQIAGIRTGVAGERAYADLISLIHDYDAALVRGERNNADELMNQIGTRFEQPDIGGDVARIIQQSRGSTETLIAGLKKEGARLEGLAPSFRDNPQQLTRQLWLDALRFVYSGPELEVLSPPTQLAAITLKVRSSQDIMQKRRQAALDRKKAIAEGKDFGPWFQRGSQISIDQSFGRLDKDAEKGRGRDDIKTAPPSGN